ncbi:MAG: hypothetical protein NVS3B21_29560 [Acidimicrobiales bacterium]
MLALRSMTRTAVGPETTGPAADGTHPRSIGWVGATALGMGGSNQSLFLLAALMASQGSAAVPLLVLGLLLSWAALPGWTELVSMWPDRVGGIAATCAEAFRPYSPVLANLTGTSYWWGWVPTCGLTALLSASALHQWYFPQIPVTLMAAVIVALFTVLNLGGLGRVTRVATWIAVGSAGLAFASAVVPVVTGHVDWHQATTFHLISPFRGMFGGVTSAMAGLYLVGFAAPAFEAAACHVGEMRDPGRNLPRAMFASAGMASLYFLVLPIVWLGVFGPKALTGDLAATLGPTFAPLVFGGGKAFAIWFMVLNMFHGTITPLGGASRTLSQLSEDGLLPRTLARRNAADVPWVATLLTAGMAALFLVGGDPVWVIAAANFTYLIGIALPSIAVLLLRRNHPDLERPYRAPRFAVGAGVVAAVAWLVSTVLGFEQFGLPTVLAGLALAYSGSLAYSWRRWQDRRGMPRRVSRSLHFKLTGAMLAVLGLDGFGYLLALASVKANDPAQTAILKDVFVAVALVTITVGLILPGMIAHSATQVAEAADELATGTLADLTRAMLALSTGDLNAARARAGTGHVDVHSADEVGAMARSFNAILDEAARAAVSLDGARDALRSKQGLLQDAAAQQAAVAELGRRALDRADGGDLLEEAMQLVVKVLGVPMGAILGLSADSLTFNALNGAGWPEGIIGTVSLNNRAYLPWGAVLLTDTSIAIGDLLEPSAYKVPGMLIDQGMRSSVWVTITSVGREPFGVLTAHSPTPNRFSQEDIHFLESIANVLGSAIERGRSEERLAYQAIHDPLTNLPNRTLFNDRLGSALERLDRHPGHVGVLFLDLDHFKLINDSFGHAQGDRVLVEMADRLRSVMRNGDTLARFGGDEFVVVAEDVTGEVELVGIADRLTEVASRPVLVGGTAHTITLSAGIAATSVTTTLAEELIRDADSAMYRAKDEGRARSALFAPALRTKVIHRVETESDLRQALQAGELSVHYQPVIMAATGEICGVEALVRWSHPVRGSIPPLEFIPVAEESGLIVPLGEFVLAEAASQLRQWHEDFPEYGNLEMAVNLSGRQLNQGDLAASVSRALEEAGLETRHLILEITESVLMRDAEASIDAVQRLTGLGVRISIDDFGTGYSSMAYLKRFRADILKIDKSFIDGLGTDAQDDAIVAATITLADALGMATVAEGVEQCGQRDLLAAMGCQQLQGFFFAHPGPAAEISALLARTAARGVLTA